LAVSSETGKEILPMSDQRETDPDVLDAVIALLLYSLKNLAAWATGPDKSGNPYSHQPVQEALKAIHEIERPASTDPHAWMDAVDAWKRHHCVPCQNLLAGGYPLREIARAHELHALGEPPKQPTLQQKDAAHCKATGGCCAEPEPPKHRIKDAIDKATEQVRPDWSARPEGRIEDCEACLNPYHQLNPAHTCEKGTAQ
jgi:hypothetical protein